MQSLTVVKKTLYFVPMLSLLLISNASFAAQPNNPIARGERGGFGEGGYHPEPHYNPQSNQFHQNFQGGEQNRYHQQTPSEGHNRYQQMQQSGVKNPMMKADYHQNQEQQEKENAARAGYDAGQDNSSGGGVYVNPYDPYYDNQSPGQYQNPYQNPNQNQNQNDPFFYQ